MDLKKDLETSMQDAIDHFKKDLSGLRTSRANPSLLNSIMVEAYGTKMKMSEIANITAPDARQLVVRPYDAGVVSAIAKAIEKENLGFAPIVDGNMVRVNIPPMDEETRKNIAKECRKKAEDAKINARQMRRKNNDLVKKQKTDGEITEDIMKSLEKTIQEKTDHACKEIDKICKEKEKEILEI